MPSPRVLRERLLLPTKAVAKPSPSTRHLARALDAPHRHLVLLADRRSRGLMAAHDRTHDPLEHRHAVGRGRVARGRSAARDGVRDGPVPAAGLEPGWNSPQADRDHGKDPLHPDARAAVREMARVLAPGGRIVLGELGRWSVWAAERRVRAWFGAETWRRARFWTRGELAALARDAGLRVGGVRGSVFFPPSGLAARAMAPLEPLMRRIHAPGAAFLALVADKTETPR